MSRYLFGLATAITALLLAAGSQLVFAESAERPLILTEAQTQAIGDSCTISKIALGQVHSNDAVMRINLGQEYVNISSRLMAPLNSRISLAGRDGVELTKLTAEYNQVLQQFRSAYSVYDDSVQAALNIDCRSRQAEYYAAVIKSREERLKVRAAVEKLNDIARRYRTEVDAFQARLEQE